MRIRLTAQVLAPEDPAVADRFVELSIKCDEIDSKAPFDALMMALDATYPRAQPTGAAK